MNRRELLGIGTALALPTLSSASIEPLKVTGLGEGLQVVWFFTEVLTEDHRLLETKTRGVYPKGTLDDLAPVIPKVLGDNYRQLSGELGNSAPITITHYLRIDGRVIKLEIEREEPVEPCESFVLK